MKFLGEVDGCPVHLGVDPINIPLGVWPRKEAEDSSGRTEVVAELATQPRGVRPSELIALLASQPDDELIERHVCRLHQWLSTDGAREEPLPLPHHATLAPHAEARAS